jgi:hypothetical protein
MASWRQEDIFAVPVEISNPGKGSVVALNRCPGCGGQINPHTTTCPWCGHSVAGSVFLQLILAAVLIIGVASFTGIFRWSRVIPQLSFSSGAPMDEPPVEATSSQPGSPGLVDQVFAGNVQRVDRISKMSRSEAGSDGSQTCGPVGAPKVQALLKRYGGWDDRVLAAVACGQVRTGFTVDQVRAAVGMPETVLRKGPGGEEQWVYHDMTLTVQNGRVTEVHR